MSVREAYNAWAATYDTDRNLTRDLDHQVMQETLADTRYSSILELGCGTGKNTALLAQIGARVQALDFSEGMISQARAKLPAPNVSYSVADLTRQWPCADRSVDLIVCNLVLEHIAELPFIFAEASRTLVAGGRFFICELHPFKQYQGSQANYQTGAEQVVIPAFVHHISDFLTAAESSGLTLKRLREWWHHEDQRAVPRLVSFMFEN
ncbi:MAG TPA: class I SAM-dependent methyltransferase [Herpetosiphonaceae bacterium]